jgi:FMN phosphatase YigB (HAD superfamily)
VTARDAFHVGDLLRTDVAGARNVGMRSVRLRAAHDDATALPEADHVAASHAELRAILGVHDFNNSDARRARWASVAALMSEARDGRTLARSGWCADLEAL